MNSTELLGKVAARYLKDLSRDADQFEGTARYLLDCLTAEETVAVAQAVLTDTMLNSFVEIKLPKTFLSTSGLPEEILTTERATYFRNAHCPKSAWLLANVGDDEQQSLTEVVPIGAPQLLSHPELWVAVAGIGLPILDEHRRWWAQALKGLVEAQSVSLGRYAEYVDRTREAIAEQGHTIRSALGCALPSLHLPRDTNYFNALNEKTSGYVSKWKKLYSDGFKKRGCCLVKQTSTQGLIDGEALAETFNKVQASIPDEYHPVVEEFINAPSGWNKPAAALAECEWEGVKPLFDGLKREKFNLGKATLEFYDERDPELLTEEEHDYLERLIARKTTESDDEDEDFYRSHRLELKEKPSLKARWDRFIYGAPIETEDFIVGVVQCLQVLFDQDQTSSKRNLAITSDKRNPKDLKELNREAGLFFAFRYRGLRDLLGRTATWDVGQLFNFAELDQNWLSSAKPYLNKSLARGALQIKFYLDLEVELSSGNTESYQKQLIWKFNPTSISSELYHDWGRLVENPLVLCQANRELVSGKGRFQSIDLQDARTLLPTYDKDRGSLVAVYQKDNDISIFWPVRLEEAVRQRRIDQITADELSTLFGKFTEAYGSAIRECWRFGFSNASILTNQMAAYSDLLISICKKAKGDRNREMLLRPLLGIGAVPVHGGPVASIVTPWHPLRLAAMASKALRVTSLTNLLVTAENIFFGDTKLYFEELKDELEHPYYPEVVLGWKETKPELLALSDHHLDYSLNEPPIIQPETYADTNENPGESALLVIDVLRRYLTLHPHERANLSVVLYNCDSARLPHAIVDRIQEIYEDEEDMRCQVILRHRNKSKLRELYERIIEASDSDADSFIASEATRDFMARLRIGIMADEAPTPEEADGAPTDVVFLQDVIARHSQLEWYLENADPIGFEEWIPPRWSRRRPAASDDMKSVVYLSCPVSSKEGWNYLTAITTFLKGDWDGVESPRLLPARQLNFNDPSTAAIFREIHNLGNWVVNYDELLDRRQLVNQNVKVIRYKQTDTQGRNMLISTKSSMTLLHRMVLQRLKNLTLNLTENELSALAQRFIDEANLVSGDLVLRAAKRGRNASELMGVVLSRYLIQRELPGDRHFGWYFLDDYADWLGQREGQIADILVLSPEIDEEGVKRLAVIISESKYIDYGSLANKRKESQKQLRDTVCRITDAVFGDPERLDRDLWLARFSDLMINGIHFPANSPIDLHAWRRAIRSDCNIYLRGYSHIFVSGPTDSPECSDFVAVAGAEQSWQEVFSRSQLRELVLAYAKHSDPIAIRRSIADIDIWKERTYRKPSGIIREVQEKADAKSDDKAGGSSVEPSPQLKASSVLGGNLSSQSEPTQQAKLTPSAEITNAWAYQKVGVFISGYQRGSKDSADDEEWLRQVESKCKGALQQFQLQSKLLTKALTPNAALLKFQGSANLTVEQVLRRRSEFLTTHGLNVISVRAEPGVVAIAVARPNRRVLHLPDVWKKWSPNCTYGNHDLLIAIREEDSGPLYLSPKSNAPHTLIAGSTGSGKSVLMQNILLGIACTNTPDQARIVLIDPKLGVDYFAFEGLPHLTGGIIDKQENAIQTLSQLVVEMDRRYSVLKENRALNIFDLNMKLNPTERLPFLWVIHDEFAEWMMTPQYSNEVSDVVGRLGVKARAAGISLVFAAQRPDASVMPMQLRANLGNRLVLRVDGEGTSEIALGEKGAERLLGKGHLAAKLEGESNVIHAQVPFVTPAEIDDLVQAIRGKQNHF